LLAESNRARDLVSCVTLALTQKYEDNMEHFLRPSSYREFAEVLMVLGT
jgi:hypothetical protein